MGSIFRKFFGKSVSENEDDILGCDMVPSPSVLAVMTGLPSEESFAQSAHPAAIGPFTTIAQAPIRDS